MNDEHSTLTERGRKLIFAFKIIQNININIKH